MTNRNRSIASKTKPSSACARPYKKVLGAVMNKSMMATLVAGILVCAPCIGLAEEGQAAKSTESPSFAHKLLFYIPNRALDILDIARCRVRVGPGLAVDVRATKAVSAFAGSYASVYAGLPGPRNRTLPKLPVGLESQSGIQASVVDATLSGGLGPDYGPAEIGVGVHALIVGVDVGIEPLEILDLLAGFFFIDLKKDDF